MQSCVASHKYLQILPLHLYLSLSLLLFVKRSVLLKKSTSFIDLYLKFNCKLKIDSCFYIFFYFSGLHQPTSSLPTSSIYLFIFVHVTVYNPSKRHCLWSFRNENYRHDQSRMDHDHCHDSDNDRMHQYIWSSSLWFVHIPWMGNDWSKRQVSI